MRLRRLLIEQYGNFERLDLPLAAEPGRINLVVAPNGAGKSVLRQAFHDLLFGYAAKSKMNFRYRTGLHLRAEAITRAGEDLHFGWRHPAGRAFPGEDHTTRLGAAMGTIKPPQLENLFALDTIRLRAGGEELAQGGDSLGLALLSGTGELMSAKAARAELAARREAVWAGTRISSRPLARASRALEDARGATRKAVQLPVQREREVSALDAETARLQAARETHAAMQTKVSRLGRIDRTRRFLEEHRAASEWLHAHPDAPVLAAGLGDELADARHQVSLTAAHRANAEQAVADDEAARAALTLDPPALDHAHALDGLQTALGEAEKAARDVVKVEAERGGHLAAVAAALRDLGATVTVERAATLLPLLADAAAARALIAQHASRVETHAADERRVRQAQTALAVIEGEKRAAPAPLDRLAALLATIRADRDPMKHLAETARAATDAATAEAAALRAVPGWSGTAAALRDSPAPPQSVFEALDKTRTAAATALREAEADRDRLGSSRSEWHRLLQDMQQRPLPDQTAIAAIRARRDAVWTLIHRHAFTPDPPTQAEIQTLISGEALPLAYDRLVREADALVDLRLLELPRVQEAERLTRELDRTAPDWHGAVAAAGTARENLAAAGDAFATQCSAIGLDRRASVADARLALTQRAAAVAAGLAADNARAAHAAVLAAHAEWTRQLRLLLPDGEDAPFATLLTAADALIRAEAEAKAARIQHEANRRNAAKALTEAQADLRVSTAALDEWRRLWAACLATLARPPGEPPAATEAVLQCLTGLAAADTGAAGLGQRVADMRADIAAFSETVARLASLLGMAPGADIFATARQLIARHQTAQRQHALVEAAHDRLLRTADALRLARAGERDAQQRLDAIIAGCGAADGDDADRRIAAARERTWQEAARNAAATGLSQNGDGLSLTDLQAEADAVTPDQAAAEREQTQAALTAARDASEAAAGKVRDLQQSLDRAAAATDLGESVRTQEGAAASFGHLLDDYLVLSLAEQMLAASVAKVEAEAGSNGVSRISAAFARVTNGDYGIDGNEGPDGKTILVAVEHKWPNEKKALAQLSEGTRDQLYLALRIVAIEDHAATAPALPFVADDILQTFDDARSLAALHALLALSQHTQVIVLTHHPHLAALAGALPEGSVHYAAL